MGGGEGVGWSAPTPSSPHSLSPALANTLKHLALVTPKEEGELGRRQVISGRSFFSILHIKQPILIRAKSRETFSKFNYTGI